MDKESVKQPFKVSKILIPALVVVINLLIIIFPQAVVQAAREGLELWFSSVLPSLFPFVVGTNLMSALGLTRKLGRLLEPVTQRLFKVSGAGGYALAVGLLSGYPMGAKTVAALRENGELNQYDANRLITFVNNSGPLFILGTVAAGMLVNEIAGYYLLVVHYVSALLTGLVFCHFLPYESEKKRKRAEPKPAAASVGIGSQLSKAVTNGMESMLMIGGFIIIFSVILRIFDELGLFSFLYSAFSPVMGLMRVDEATFSAVLGGALEMTNGLKQLFAHGPSEKSLILAAALLGFGGFSIHAQSAGFMSKSDISLPLYLLAKTAQAVVSALVAMLALPFFYGPIQSSHSTEVFRSLPSGFVRTLGYSSAFYLLLCAVTGLAAVGAALAFNRVRKPRRRARR